uniref:Uncharacterized protein n=1 Tax=Brassica oleracea TaxID=3712 RepID=A0A3P6F3E7_BRAOL|nr:unnamed protein product [Brassica oleracea]
MEEKQHYRAKTRHESLFLDNLTRNGKLFKGIYKNPWELVRHAESECQAWFDANDLVQLVVQDNSIEEPQVISLGNICFGGNIQLMGTRNFTRRKSAFYSEVEALRWAMENMLQLSTCQTFGTLCKELIAIIKEPHA